MKTNKAMAKFFYEQCAGTYCGHMANVANNPTLFGLCAAHAEKADSVYALTQTDFAALLHVIANELES